MIRSYLCNELTEFWIFFGEINHVGDNILYGKMMGNRDFEINSIPSGSDMTGSLVRTKDGWQECKVFDNELHGWSFLLNGVAAWDIRL